MQLGKETKQILLINCVTLYK